MQPLFVFLATLLLFSNQHQVEAAKHSSSHSHRKDCRKEFAILCQQPCAANSTDTLTHYECVIDCYTANADTLGSCPAPPIPRHQLKNYNCSDVAKVRCKECNNGTESDVDNVGCIAECAKNKFTSFKECKFDHDEVPGGEDLDHNCTAAIRDICNDCFSRKQTMDDRLKCLDSCTTNNEIQDSCKKGKSSSSGPKVVANCTDLAEQCPQCSSSPNPIKCLRDCSDSKGKLKCDVQPGGNVPGQPPLSQECSDVVATVCDFCNTSEDIVDKAACIYGCTLAQKPCQKGGNAKDCVQKTCPSCKQIRSDVLQQACFTSCAANNAEAIVACVQQARSDDNKDHGKH